MPIGEKERGSHKKTRFRNLNTEGIELVPADRLLNEPIDKELSLSYSGDRLTELFGRL